MTYLPRYGSAQPEFSSSKWCKHQSNVWNLFKVNDKNTRTTSILVTLLIKIWTYFTNCFGIFIIDLRKQNNSWVLFTCSKQNKKHCHCENIVFLLLSINSNVNFEQVSNDVSILWLWISFKKKKKKKKIWSSQWIPNAYTPTHKIVKHTQKIR